MSTLERFHGVLEWVLEEIFYNLVCLVSKKILGFGDTLRCVGPNDTQRVPGAPKEFPGYFKDFQGHYTSTQTNKQQGVKSLIKSNLCLQPR